MRCKKHLTDFSSSVGVCSSCLRERLSALIEAQILAEARAQQMKRGQEDRRKCDAYPPSFVFPRSVSPCISHCKSDYSFPNHHHTLSDQFFFSTPQIRRTSRASVTVQSESYKKKKKFSFLSKLFRSKLSTPNSCMAPSSSRSWFSNMLSSGHLKKETSACSLDQSIFGRKTRHRYRDRGMSPVTVSEYEGEEGCSYRSSGYSTEEWKQTPQRSAYPVRRCGGATSHSRNVSGLFCLSPLVRASPNPHWIQKGIPPEILCNGEARVPSVAAAFVKNRSRKIADFGKH